MRAALFLSMAGWLVAGGPMADVARAEELPAPTGEAIVAPGAKIEWLFTRTAPIKGGLTEGVCAGPDGCLYFSDIPLGKDKGQILKFDPKSKKTSIFAEDSFKSNGLCFDARGGLLACEGSDYGGRAVARWDLATGKRSVIADRYLGKRFNAPNDLCVDTKGRIYFTDPRYLGHEPRELEHRAVYRIGTDSQVTQVTRECEKPNGIALSPDEKTLYLADHNNGSDQIDPDAPAPKLGAMKIYAFPLGADGLVSGERKTIYEFGEEPGCDGMCVDSEGRLYLTARAASRPGVLVLSPQGKEVGFIPTGEAKQDPKSAKGLPSNVDFGIGPEKNTLYITVDVSLCRIKLKSEGYHVPWAPGVAR